MKPFQFWYHRPRVREEVDGLLAEFGDEAKILAGGQSLVPLLNARLATPSHVIDITYLEDEERNPRVTTDAVVMGPVVRYVSVESSLEVTRRLPLLPESIRHVGHPAIRTRGTVVGSIAHADPSAEIPAVFTLVGGEARMRSTRGIREVSATQLFIGPFTTSVADDEWIEEVRFPTPSNHVGYSFLEFSRRRGDFAIVGVAAMVRIESDEAHVSLVFCGVGAKPALFELPPFPAKGIEPEIEERLQVIAREDLDPPEDLQATKAYRRWLSVRMATGAVRLAGRAAVEEL